MEWGLKQRMIRVPKCYCHFPFHCGNEILSTPLFSKIMHSSVVAALLGLGFVHHASAFVAGPRHALSRAARTSSCAGCQHAASRDIPAMKLVQVCQLYCTFCCAGGSRLTYAPLDIAQLPVCRYLAYCCIDLPCVLLCVCVRCLEFEALFSTCFSVGRYTAGAQMMCFVMNFQINMTEWQPRTCVRPGPAVHAVRNKAMPYSLVTAGLCWKKVFMARISRVSKFACLCYAIPLTLPSSSKAS